MKLFTKDINQKLFAQYRIGSNLNKQNVVAKIFNPYGRGRWYLLNSDPNDPDYLWAIVQMGDEVEIGSVSRSELESIRIKPYNLPLERDMYFSERNAMEVLDGLEKGQTFARGGMVAGRWYKDTSGKEFRYIGESQGKLLFNDGTKIVEKDENDFEEEPTKERKLFGLFKDGGIIKGRNNETGESFGVVIGSIKKSDEYVEGGNEMNVRISYSSRMGENKLVFDSNGNLFGIMFYPYVMDGFPDTSYGSFHTYNADKKETIKVLSDMYSPAFAKRLIELAKGNKMEEGGETQGKWIPKNFIGFGTKYKPLSNGDKIRMNLGNGKYYYGTIKGQFIEWEDGAKSDTQRAFEGANANGKEVLRFEEGGETSEMKEDFLEDIKETHGAIKEITLEDGSKVSRKEMMAAHHNLKQAKYGTYLEKGGYVAVSEKDGYWYIMSKPSTKEKAEQMIALGVPKGEVGKVVTLDEAKAHKKVIGKEYLAMGGKVKFEDKVKAIEKSLLKRKKVSPSVQKDYGKTYNKKEAHESAQRIVGARVAKYEFLKNLKKGKK